MRVRLYDFAGSQSNTGEIEKKFYSSLKCVSQILIGEESTLISMLLHSF